jgi:hypothetical protein
MKVYRSNDPDTIEEHIVDVLIKGLLVTGSLLGVQEIYGIDNSMYIVINEQVYSLEVEKLTMIEEENVQ